MITVTTACMKKMAKWTAKEQELVMSENLDTNFCAMVTKCDELSKQLEAEGKTDLAEKMDNLKFMAGVFASKKKYSTDNVSLEIV